MLQRRALLAGLGWTCATLTTPAALAATPERRSGRLLAIGGAEDRLRDRIILQRFVGLCTRADGVSPQILVLTAASSMPDDAWKGYETVFAELGAQASHLDLRTTDDAQMPDAVQRILSADGIFISGGDQRRLMATLWESEAARAMHLAFHLRGCCIGGTSAGAAALSRLMLAIGDTPALPQRQAVSLDIGLGFISNAIIDQHFSERRRLGRLLSAMAQRPDVLGVGIDEDTALLIERGLAVEVLGQGAVTLVDGRQMRSNLKDAEPQAPLEMLDVRLHLLPAGHRYSLRPGPNDSPLPPGLRLAVQYLVAPGPIRG